MEDKIIKETIKSLDTWHGDRLGGNKVYFAEAVKIALDRVLKNVLDNSKEESFNKILKDCEDKYEKKKTKYGESWKQMTPGELSIRMFQEMDEFKQAKNNKEAYGEIVDIINCALMIGSKLNYAILGDSE